jgi:AraC-like DNA-binding protein
VDFAPVEVRFRHPSPERLDEHRRFFRAPIHFDDRVTALVVRRELLAAPLVRSDPGLCAVLERQVHETLARIPKVNALSERVRHLIARDLTTGEPHARAIAAALHMSPRTLQRQLGHEGTTLRALVDDLRRDLAGRYLSERKIAIAEVAFLLGFSEASAFHRAFKRWSGTTPAEYRRTLGA